MKPQTGSSGNAGAAVPYVALTGNPNCGKTTLFNALTGLRAKVGNYAGVTVERKEGKLKGTPDQAPVMILDLPGTYSLSPKSLDEQVSRDVLFHRLPDVPAPSLVVVVVDASNLQRNLYYATQVIELGYPVLLALNMVDVAEENGHQVNPERLSRELGVPVIPMVASKQKGLSELRAAINQKLSATPTPLPLTAFYTLPALYQQEVRQFAELIRNLPGLRKVSAESEALLTLSDSRPENLESYTAEVRTSIPQARERLKQVGIDWRSVAIEARYACIGRIYRNCVVETEMLQESFSDKLDRVVTHRVWGMFLFLVIMAVMFQSIFTFAAVPMELISNLVDGLGKWVESALPPGALTDLIVNGVIAGVGAVVVFLPQILLLFLFISLLEDTGYMARAAFIMDRLMSKVGLHGKSFIPMLSSFACAIPGIMATRTIESPKDRLATILIAPLMSCSARLPVYAVLIACCIPDKRVLGIFKLTGLTMLGMYLLGVVVALAMAWVFKRTLAKGVTPLLIMELPAYKRPVLTVILRHMWDRGKMFLQQAGTVILGINIILWFLTTYPHNPQVRQEFAERESQVVRTTLPPTSPAPAVIAKVEELKKQFAHQAPATNDPLFAMYEQFQTLEREERSARLQHSFAGRFGRLFEPFIAPLGFDWKMGIGIFASFAAREVFVSTMSIIYSAESGDGDNANEGLVKTMQQQRHRDGTLVYTTLTGITLMVFYVLALQCASTIAVVKRETGSWKWPIFQWCYMGVLAWVFAFITYQGGKLLGWG